jgi:hypothetical protein
MLLRRAGTNHGLFLAKVPPYLRSVNFAADSGGPDPVDGLTMHLTARYLDTSGDVQLIDASDGDAEITVVAPAYIRFDATGSRSEEPDADDQIGAWLNLGCEWDFDDDGGVNWPFAGPQGTVRMGYDRRSLRAGHIYREPGTRTMRVKIGDSADRVVERSITINVLDPLTALTRVDLTTGMGAWPTLVNHRCYTFNGNYDSWGVPNTNGLVNIAFVPHPDATTTPSIAGLTFDTRVDGALSGSITRPRGIRSNGIHVGDVRWGPTGFDWCSVSNGSVTSCGPSISQSYMWDQALVQPWGNESVANNIRFPIGFCLWNTGECNSYGDFGLYSNDIIDASYYGLDLNKDDLAEGGQGFRGRWKRAIFRNCRVRCENPATGYGRFEGGECRAANGNMPDEWREDGRVGYYGTGAGGDNPGYKYGYAAEDIDFTNFYFGAAGETQPENGIGTGPENNLVGFPPQGQRRIIFENGHIHIPGVSVSFGGGMAVGARHLRYASNGEPVPIAWTQEGGTGNVNRLPGGLGGGEDSPKINETNSTRKVLVSYEP